MCIRDRDYNYEFTDLSTNAVTTKLRTNALTNLNLIWVSGLSFGHSYSVRVKSKVNGNWSDYGSPCTITIGGARYANVESNDQQIASEITPFTATIFPNPISDNSTASINITGADGKLAIIKILDLTGKEIITYQMKLESEEFNTTLNDFPKLSSGMYILSISIEDKVQNSKFVVE